MPTSTTHSQPATSSNLNKQTKYKQTKARTNDKPTATEKALTILHNGVQNIMTSKGWQDALAFRNKFYSYSFFNSVLIYAQRPEATYVAGYSKWKELGRQVKKGEKGISILAPLIRKPNAQELKTDPTAKENEKRLVGFRSVYVFDASQTKGEEPIPELERPALLDGYADKSTLIDLSLCKLLSFAAQNKIETSFDLEATGALGVYYPDKKHIAVKASLPPLQKLKTFTHELAHALLHDLNSDRDTAELEAESCAYLVCNSLGLDTSQYSFAYLANWTNSLDDLIAAGDRASKAAQEITAALEPGREEPDLAA